MDILYIFVMSVFYTVIDVTLVIVSLDKLNIRIHPVISEEMPSI